MRKHNGQFSSTNLTGLWLLGVTTCLSLYAYSFQKPEIISPLSSKTWEVEAKEPAPNKFTTDDMSEYISQAVQEFLPTHKSESLMIMHCLAHRENGHGANNNCGDSGKACGPFQFHQPTWEGYRKMMIKNGLASEIGDRYDKKESARTTAWAISTNRAYAWGPISRDHNGSDYATCQTPSWYK